MSKRADSLKQQIFKCDPYEGFDVSQHEFDPHGWHDNVESFNYIFDLLRPQSYFECGVWKGKSVRWAAQKMKDLEIEDPVVVAIDNWLGSIEHWGGTLKAKTKLGGLDLRNGYPQFYYTFLANTMLTGHQDIVVPFPTNSLTAMRYLKEHGYKAEVVYIDAAHTYPEVYDDLTMAKDLLKDKNSLIIGDDLSPWFPEVSKCVKKFQEENPGWKLIKDGFGFVLLPPEFDLPFSLPKKPKKVKEAPPKPAEIEDPQD